MRRRGGGGLAARLGTPGGRLAVAAVVALVTVGGLYIAGRRAAPEPAREPGTVPAGVASGVANGGMPTREAGTMPAAPPVPTAASSLNPPLPAPVGDEAAAASPPPSSRPTMSPPVQTANPAEGSTHGDIGTPRMVPSGGTPRIVAPSGGTPRIVIVIDDMGLDRPRTARAVALPAAVTTSWLPYAHDLAEQTAAARRAGHELIVHVPMQPVGRADPGPDALTTDLPDAEIARRLSLDLAAFDGYVGINNHMGSRFTADRHGMEVVLRILAQRHLLFLDSRTTAASTAGEIAPTLHLPMLSRDVFLDDDQSPRAVWAQLARVEEVARRHGLAIAIGHPHDSTLAALHQWLPTLAAKGFRLVPLTGALAGKGAAPATVAAPAVAPPVPRSSPPGPSLPEPSLPVPSLPGGRAAAQ